MFAMHKFNAKHVICSYLGRYCQPNDTHGMDAYKFEVRRQGKVSFIIDATNPKQSSIARYVNAPLKFEDANCKFMQHNEQVYLVTVRKITKGEELLAWYGEHTSALVKVLHRKK